MRRLVLVGVAALGACGDDAPSAPDASALPAWDKELPPSEVMGSWGDLVAARGIIHLHSPYSHDACDGEPRADGSTGPIDEDCLADLRAGLCATRIDYAALTDHDDSMADEEFATLLLQRGDDELVLRGDAPIANRVHCESGHTALLTVGGENPLMPIMLDAHVPGTIEERHAAYNADGAAAADVFRAAGALVWVPHTEQRTADELEPMAPTGVEVYQLHANLAPDLREEFLGLDPSGAITAVVDFADTNPGHPEPDLALISFVEANTPALTTWDALLARGLHVAGSAGSDAHENALPVDLADGERGDSYRRVMRWFSNVALVADRDDPAAIEAALAAGRMFVAFEVLGTPVGLDIHAGDVQLGGTAPVGATLDVTAPTIHALDPSLPAPEITVRVIRVTSAGATTVVETTEPHVTVSMDQAGAYRVEILMRPLHLHDYLGRIADKGYAERVLPWIYASPIYAQ